ncbi:MAG: XTP/dITP diphosphatase [Candidatus Heimdallarchaeota archaeon]
MKSPLYFVTSNEHKFREAQTFLQTLKIDIKHICTHYTEIQHQNLTKIAKYGAIEVSKKYKGKIFVEDAGLFVTHLNGFPGPYSNYAYLTIRPVGLLKLLDGVKDRSAYFQSVIALAREGVLEAVFDGKIMGSISETLRGHLGFAFDVCFIPEGFNKTFAEISLHEKNKISHRRRSLEKLAHYLNRFH